MSQIKRALGINQTLTAAAFAEWWDEIFIGVDLRGNERREIEESEY